MHPEIERHPDEDQIERYSLGEMGEAELAPLECHLLTCDSCRRRVAESDAYVSAMRQAAAAVRADGARRRRRFRGLPRLAPAFALAAVAFLAVWIWSHSGHPAYSPAQVVLTAMRGAPAPNGAPAGRPLALTPDLNGIPAGQAYRLEVVDPTGAPVWRGPYPGPAVPGLAKGRYFVRLYGSAGDLLREYGMEVGMSR